MSFSIKFKGGEHNISFFQTTPVLQKSFHQAHIHVFQLIFSSVSSRLGFYSPTLKQHNFSHDLHFSALFITLSYIPINSKRGCIYDLFKGISRWHQTASSQNPIQRQHRSSPRTISPNSQTICLSCGAAGGDCDHTPLE
ncbi:hypothetical protein Droror1_Dr00011713 [Drosera rotundifolia]